MFRLLFDFISIRSLKICDTKTYSKSNYRLTIYFWFSSWFSLNKKKYFEKRKISKQKISTENTLYTLYKIIKYAGSPDYQTQTSRMIMSYIRVATILFSTRFFLSHSYYYTLTCVISIWNQRKWNIYEQYDHSSKWNQTNTNSVTLKIFHSLLFLSNSFAKFPKILKKTNSYRLKWIQISVMNAANFRYSINFFFCFLLVYCTLRFRRTFVRCSTIFLQYSICFLCKIFHCFSTSQF